MRTIIYLIKKEFLQIFRNKLISKAVFAVPILQMLILVPAITFEIKNVRIAVVDADRSVESGRLVNKLSGSEFFIVKGFAGSVDEAVEMMHQNRCDVVLNFPAGFGKAVGTGEGAQVQVVVNAINAVAAQLSWAYLNGVIREYNVSLAADQGVSPMMLAMPSVSISNRFWYNQLLNYKYYMLPGILVILVTAIGFLMSGLNMVREKETGTIEQINVTPVKKYQFILSKMIPFLLIGLIDLSLGLLIGRLAFSIPFEGSLLVMFLGASIFLIGILGLALFISTFSDTQQQYMFIAFFFTMIFILMSGIFTPAESMPVWAQKFNIVNPVAYLMRINRMVMLKGSGLADIRPDLIALTLIAAAFSLLAVWRYKKTV
jgi:ABC-2 type transport system permease protein